MLPNTSIKRACMVGYTFYESDNRVRRYAETLVECGFHVDAFVLRRKGEFSISHLKGVTVYKIQERNVDEKQKFTYLFRILKFLIRSMVMLTKMHFAKPYHIIHVHSVPDFEVFSALIPRLLGAKVILDIHDIVPEFYSSKFDKNTEGLLYKSLILIETLSAKFANHVIISNHLWYKSLVNRSTSPLKCTVIINYPDKKFFFSSRNSIYKNNDKFVFLYPGTLNWHQGLDIAIEAFSQIADEFPYTEFHIYGEGPSKQDLANLSRNLKLEDRVIFKGMVSSDEIPSIMSSANVGIVPKRNDFFGGDAFSTKTLEFMALGVPIILSRTRIDSLYFNNKVVRFFTPESINDLVKAMREFIKNEKLREIQASKAKLFAEQNNWDRKKNIYLKIVEHLLD